MIDKVQLSLPKDTVSRLKKVAKLADVTTSQVVSVMLAMAVVTSERKKNPNAR